VTLATNGTQESKKQRFVLRAEALGFAACYRKQETLPVKAVRNSD